MAVLLQSGPGNTSCARLRRLCWFWSPTGCAAILRIVSARARTLDYPEAYRGDAQTGAVRALGVLSEDSSELGESFAALISVLEFLRLVS